MEPALDLGPCSLGTFPRIVAIIERSLDERELVQLRQQGVTVLEIRVDAFDGGLTAALRFLESPLTRDFGRLGTIRSTEANRSASFERLLPLVDAIDVEVESPERQELVSMARTAGRRVLLSTHDFEQTPSRTRLNAVVAEGRALGVDLVKIAAFARTTRDLLDLLEFTRHSDFAGRLITIAMGEHGLLSRIAAPFFGSLLSYGFLERANAPGQLSVADLHAGLYRYHPEYRSDFDLRMQSTYAP